MLSPGKDHLQVPKDPLENMDWRKWVLKRCREDKDAQWAMIEACRRDIIFYINTFVFQFNPLREGHEVEPFITWNFQDNPRTGAFQKILWAIENREDLVIEKSREMGASWMCLMVMDWICQFHPNKQFLMISRSAEAVDSFSPNSLFWKIDFIHKYLPDWLAPHCDRKDMYFGYPKTDSTITGEASTKVSGTGGRATGAFLDEFSAMDRKTAYGLLRHTRDTSLCRIFNFTHRDDGDCAGELAERVDVAKLRLHWSMHPSKNAGLYQYNDTKKKVEHKRYNPETGDVETVQPFFFHGTDFNFVMDGKLRSPWYDNECRVRKDSRAIAMDLDIDRMGASKQFFDQLLLSKLEREFAREPVWKGDVEFDPNTGKPIRLTRKSDGRLHLWIYPDAKGCPPPSFYLIAGDIATGTGATPTCFSILDGRTGNKVGAYVDPFIKEEDAAAKMVALCWLFKNEIDDGAMLGWEIPGPGIKFGSRVLELGYRRLYYMADEGNVKFKKSDRPGWMNDGGERLRLLLSHYKEALYKHSFLNPCKYALKECLFFRYGQGGKIEHQNIEGGNDPSGARVNHGDRTMADAIAWTMAKGGVILEEKRIAEEVQVLSLAWRREQHENRRKQEAW
jgi:hypothetical protein